MRHRMRIVRIGRSAAHRKAMLSEMVCSLIDCRRIKTTLTKAKLARSLAEKMVTLGKRADGAGKKHALTILGDKAAVQSLCKDIVPSFATRNGGYTRIIKLGRRASDGSEMALLEWVGITVPDRTKKKKPEKAVTAKK